MNNWLHRSGALAALVEDWIYAGLRRWGRWRGLIAQPFPLAAYGSAPPSDPNPSSPTDFARIIVRVLMVSPHYDRWEFLRQRRGFWQFLSLQLAGVPVQIRLGAATLETITDRGGYVDVVLRGHGLPAGWHDAVVSVSGGKPVSQPVQIVGAEPIRGIISDVDDTIMNTALPRPFLAFWNAFVAHTKARSATVGMPKFFAALQAECPGPVIYLSTGAWNVIGNLQDFVRRHGYPRGSFLLTDWGPSNTGWFRSGQEHKRTQLRRLAAELPQVSWVLVGDNGQHDPQIYREFALEFPDLVDQIVIRTLSQREHFFAHGTVAPLKVVQSKRSFKDRLVGDFE
ncbi:App1 family protein [Boudabousia marimammalium]|uniref:Phosphatidate phosphatase APP1 catalytic domain-containing protein n=1 Tax=Boudabousia marimammalium TaxID=156892 RepID=A0A1Q5PT01_9ACTO|nr:phosphatase domain-containing protein [Boudabousia marimammalium]OKL50500.1 hypothetical protein BM477_00560 [Boudabousia marimammalium]